MRWTRKNMEWPRVVVLTWTVLWMLVAPLVHIHPEADHRHGAADYWHGGTFFLHESISQDSRPMTTAPQSFADRSFLLDRSYLPCAILA